MTEQKNGIFYKRQIDTNFIFTLGFNKAQDDYFPLTRFISYIIS